MVALSRTTRVSPAPAGCSRPALVAGFGISGCVRLLCGRRESGAADASLQHPLAPLQAVYRGGIVVLPVTPKCGRFGPIWPDRLSTAPRPAPVLRRPPSWRRVPSRVPSPSRVASLPSDDTADPALATPPTAFSGRSPTRSASCPKRVAAKRPRTRVFWADARRSSTTADTRTLSGDPWPVTAPDCINEFHAAFTFRLGLLPIDYHD